MQSRHRRAPSAMPSVGYEDVFDYGQSDLLSTLPLPKYQAQAKDSNNFKVTSKIPAASQKSQMQKFSYNYCNSLYNDHSKLECSSNASSGKGVTQFIDVCDQIEDLPEDTEKDPMVELKEAVEAVMRKRMWKINKINGVRKNIKAQLLMVVREEGEDRDTDRRKDYNKCSENTAEGNGFTAEDYSLVKFDASIEQNERRRKVLKFKDY